MVRGYLPEKKSILQVSGKDARDFLHRLISCNVRTLEVGQVLPGTLLKASGKLIAYFHIYGLDETTFALVTPQSCLDELYATLDRLVFSEKLTFTKDEQTSLLMVVDTSPDALFRLEALQHQEQELGSCTARIGALGHHRFQVWIREKAEDSAQNGPPGPPTLGGEAPLDSFQDANALNDLRSTKSPKVGGFRGLCVSSVESTLQQAGIQEMEPTEYASFRIQQGLPEWEQELDSTVIPVGLRLDQALDPDKGCYTGQEIVSKMSFVGHPPHVLLGLKVQGTPVVGSKALKGETIVGTVTSAAPGLALLCARWERTAPGEKVLVESEGQTLQAEVVALPMVTSIR
jgi:tRNA-modifying protein YgfZ